MAFPGRFVISLGNIKVQARLKGAARSRGWGWVGVRVRFALSSQVFDSFMQARSVGTAQLCMCGCVCVRVMDCFGARELWCVSCYWSQLLHIAQSSRSGCFSSSSSIGFSFSCSFVSGFNCNLMARLKSLKYFPSAPGPAPARRSELVQNYV